MNILFSKLNYKDQKRIAVLNEPNEFLTHLSDLKITIDKSIDTNFQYDFLLVFVLKCEEISQVTNSIKNNLTNDVTLWFAYPKKSSKKYKSDISRDGSWQSLGDIGFEGVRQVAIDDDWSALRFRNVKFIKTLSRDKSRAMSKEGKKRV